MSKDLRVVILRSIMSISLADQRQANYLNSMRYPSDLVFISFEDAIDQLQHVLTGPTSILGLQAAMSVQLFLVSMLRLNAASRIGGLINRMALQLGLHRCSTRYSTFSAAEKQLRQRIFWVLYALDRFICQSMGLPLGISDDDVDVCFPTAELHLNDEPETVPGMCADSGTFYSDCLTQGQIAGSSYWISLRASRDCVERSLSFATSQCVTFKEIRTKLPLLPHSLPIGGTPSRS